MRVRTSVLVAATALAVTSGSLLALSPATERASAAPAAVPPLVDPVAPVAVVTGGTSSFVLTQAGRVLAAGHNGFGQLADTTTTNRTTPVEVRDTKGPLTDVVQVATSGRHTLLLRGDGTVLSAGVDDLGQLGRGTTARTDAAHPVVARVVSPTGKGTLARIVQVATGTGTSFALGADGRVYGWGSGAGSVLGRPAPDADPVPSPVVLRAGEPLTGITRISCGDKHCLALGASGRLYSWGAFGTARGRTGTTSSYAGLVTDGATDTRLTAPVRTFGTGATSSFAVGADGFLYSWGSNVNGMLGVRTGGVSFVTKPAPVVSAEGEPVGGVARVTAGTWHTVAVTPTGGVLVWGTSADGQIGPIAGTAGSTVQPHPVPLALPDGVRVVAAVAQGNRTLLQTGDGGVLALGRGGLGVLLLGDITQTGTPTASALTGIGVPPLRVTDDPWLVGSGALGTRLSVGNLRVAPFPTTITYQWFRSGSRIRGATAATYTVTVADVTKGLSARITVSRPGFGSATTRTDEHHVDRPLFSVVTAPSITGTPRVGSTLTASPGSYRPTPATVSYQWTRDGVRIAGATSRTYRLKRADRGHKVLALVTVGKDPYRPATTASNALRIR